MAQIMFYRYVDDAEGTLIYANRRIEPAPHQTCKWYTPDRYETGADAQKFLAMPYTPTCRIGPFPAEWLPDFDHAPLRLVSPANAQPGGGLEVATTKKVHLFDFAKLS